MIIDSYISKAIENNLIADNKLRDEEHVPSGKLSAGTIYQPTRFQLLKALGIRRRELDAYTLGKFKRGADVENWYISELAKIDGLLISHNVEQFNLTTTDGQAFAQYRGAVGYVDSLIDTGVLGYDMGVIPNEIKSVVNSKLKKINKMGVDMHYRLQACFYAMAMGVDNYAVTIVSAEDLRTQTYIYQTNSDRGIVDAYIDEFDDALDEYNQNGTIPPFEAKPEAKWAVNPKYAMFDPIWMSDDTNMIKRMIDNQLNGYFEKKKCFCGRDALENIEVCGDCL